MRQWLSAENLLWLGGHIVLLLIGVIFIVSGSPSAGKTATTLQIAAYGVGTSLAAAGIAGEVLFLYVRATTSARDGLESLSVAGIRKVFDGRAAQIRSEYDSRIHNAREIDILGFGLAALREDYGRSFRQWTAHAKVRVLLLDPDYPEVKNSFASQRDSEENNPAGRIKGDVQAFLSLLDEERVDKSVFQVRLISALPSINLFRIDDEMFWGPYLINQQSRNAPTFLVRRGGFLFERYKKHFDDLWNGRFSKAP